MKMKKFCKLKDIAHRTRWQPTYWERLTSNIGLISQIYEQLKKLNTNNQYNSILKIMYRTKQQILNRRITNDRESLKEMFKVLSHQRNENQNNSEVSSYTGQND